MKHCDPVATGIIKTDNLYVCPFCGANTNVAGYVYGVCNACTRRILLAARKKLEKP